MFKKPKFNFGAHVIFWAVTFTLILMLLIPKMKYQIENNSMDADIDLKRKKYKDLQLQPFDDSFEFEEIRRKWNRRCPWDIHNKTHNKNMKTVVLVPYRNRTENLKLFLSPIHEHLINQVRWVLSIMLSYNLCTKQSF